MERRRKKSLKDEDLTSSKSVIFLKRELFKDLLIIFFTKMVKKINYEIDKCAQHGEHLPIAGADIYLCQPALSLGEGHIGMVDTRYC